MKDILKARRMSDRAKGLIDEILSDGRTYYVREIMDIVIDRFQDNGWKTHDLPNINRLGSYLRINYNRVDEHNRRGVSFKKSVGWETVVKRKEMRDVYKRFIDEIIEESTEPIYAREIHTLLWDKFEKYRASHARVISNRDFPELRSIVYYLKINHKATGIKSSTNLYGGNN
jgi:hypothetical protein